MPAVNRTSFFNQGLAFIGDAGRTHKVPKGRRVAVVANPVTGAAGAAYYMRGWDSGTLSWVVWGPNQFVLTTPSPSQTTPNYTGTLSAIHIVSGP